QAEATRQAHDVRVHHEALGFAVSDAEDDISGLAADTVELDEFIERVGYFAAMFLCDAPATVADGARLIAEEAGAANHEFKLHRRCHGEVGGSAIALEKRGGDEVYARV